MVDNITYNTTNYNNLSAPPSTTDETDGQAFNQLMSDVSANGTSKQTVINDGNAFLAAAGNGDQQTKQAVQNMITSLSNGTYSQQGTQGALEQSAQQDNIQGVTSLPVISGLGDINQQNSGAFSPGGQSGGSLQSNTNILVAELNGGAPSSQLENNANALANEAGLAGNTGLQQAAEAVASGVQNGDLNSTAAANLLNTQWNNG